MAFKRLPVIASVLLTCVMAWGQEHVAVPRATREAVAWQVALECEGFSPGVIDGRIGAKTSLATREFQRARDLPVTGKLDEATAASLNVNAESCLTSYTVLAADQAMVTGIPKTWPEKAEMKLLGYEAIIDGIAEKHHCSPALLALLNPGMPMSQLQPGDTLTVPALGEMKKPRAKRLEINLTQKIIRAYNAEEQLVGLFHCSIAARVEKRPQDMARVVCVNPNPNYTFDPAMWPEVKDVTVKLIIPPGPRNPVGLCWIGLNLPGYGIHGTPHPQMIGKTGSHGCFRLTNWDALRLGKMIAIGTPVTFVN